MVSEPVPPHAGPARSPALRAVVVALALGAALLTVLDHRSFRQRRAQLTEIAVRPEVVEVAARLDETLLRETDLDRTASGIARLILLAEVARGEDGITGAARDAAAARLELALDLGAQALRARPTMEAAAAAIGGAKYSLLRRDRDRRLVAEARIWETPLQLAHNLRAGGDGSRLLAIAYLELWSFLSPEKQAVARDLLADAFRDQRLFGRMVEPWLQIASSREEAFSLVPDRVASWTALERLYASRRDWEGFLLAVNRRDEALRREVAATLDAAARLARSGNVARAAERYLGVLAQLPPAVENAALARRVLAEAPAAAPQVKQQAGVRAWLDWTLDLCLGARCPLPAEAIDRLRGRAGDLPPPTRALAALFGGRPVSEQLERSDSDLGASAWSDYLIARARSQAERGEVGEAFSTLARVHSSATTDPVYWLARRDVARAAGDAQDLDLAERELGGLARERWRAADWAPPADRSGAATLHFFARNAAKRLSVVLEAPVTGAAVEVRLDGSQLALAIVSERSELELDAPIGAGVHRLEVVSRGGGSVSPSDVLLGY